MLRGRRYVLPGDIADVAGDVVAHRMVLTFDALADGVDPRWLVHRLVSAVRPPRVAPAQDDAAAPVAVDHDDADPDREAA